MAIRVLVRVFAVASTGVPLLFGVLPSGGATHCFRLSKGAMPTSQPARGCTGWSGMIDVPPRLPTDCPGNVHCGLEGRALLFGLAYFSVNWYQLVR